ncbi:MAG TPA: KEOPS complex N(6)-L-threonylcarbamoyladenine synthase Kae1 [Nitrososphaeraceae archaeon]|jgi:N6-L-threonylcarbamoyladenine synthase|nr:KEOPS complex N(6)-L-threonylcarbamoyladenine synthase Kae1 [Nitrososphaeraceae archaeon]
MKNNIKEDNIFCLGIESTAHTFGCSVIQFDLLKKKGKIISESRTVYKPPDGAGIHPREASRHHLDKSPNILREVLIQANLKPKEIDLISYSAGPGLGPCLRVGAVIARALSSFYNIPIIPVNHALGHIELGMMLTECRDPLVLLVSGGHTMVLAFSNKKWRVFGETQDITIGQLLDQFGRFLGFASPCGNKIEKYANQSSKKYYHLPYIVKGNDVSFSGILTAAKKLIEKKYNKFDICFSLQETAFAMLTEVVERALAFTEKKEVLIVGGVSANNRLSTMLKIASKRQKATLYTCPLHFSGDNGAQIAWTAICEKVASGRAVKVQNALINQSWRLDKVEVNWR